MVYSYNIIISYLVSLIINNYVIYVIIFNDTYLYPTLIINIIKTSVQHYTVNNN